VTGMKLFFGRILRAHPYLQVNDDKLEVAATPKGKSEKALDVMLDVAEKEITAGLESPRVMITHSHGGTRVDYCIERLTKFVDRENIVVTNAGAVISSHCGEGTIGVLYIRK
ncbi:MAG: DegV family protein, partial [Bacilli bacterium]